LHCKSENASGALASAEHRASAHLRLGANKSAEHESGVIIAKSAQQQPLNSLFAPENEVNMRSASHLGKF